MGIAKEIKTLGRGIFIYGFSSAILKFFGIITVPIFTRIFLPADYGVIEMIAIFANFLSPILFLGMLQSLQAFYFDVKQEERFKIISTIFFTVSIWTLVVVGVLFFYSAGISSLLFKTTKYSFLIRIALLTLFFNTLGLIARDTLRFNFQSKKFVVVSSFNGLGGVLIVILLVVFFKIHLFGYYLGWLIIAFLVMLLAFYFVRRYLKFAFSIDKFKKMLRYGLPFVPTGLVFVVVLFSDRFLLGRLTTLENVGLYSVAFKIASILMLALSWFSLAWGPYAFRIFHKNKEHPAIFSRMLTYILIIFCFAAIGLTVLSPEVLKVLTVPVYYGAWIAVGPLCLSVVALAANQITSFSLAAVKIAKFAFPVTLITALINLGLNFALIPYWGILGAAVATAISQTFLAITYYVITHKVVKLWRFNTGKVITVCIVAVGYIVGTYFIKIPNLFLSIPLKLVYAFSFFPVLYLLNVFEYSEVKYLRMMFSKEYIRDNAIRHLKFLIGVKQDKEN